MGFRKNREEVARVMPPEMLRAFPYAPIVLSPTVHAVEEPHEDMIPERVEEQPESPEIAVVSGVVADHSVQQTPTPSTLPLSGDAPLEIKPKKPRNALVEKLPKAPEAKPSEAKKAKQTKKPKEEKPEID